MCLKIWGQWSVLYSRQYGNNIVQCVTCACLSANLCLNVSLLFYMFIGVDILKSVTTLSITDAMSLNRRCLVHTFTHTRSIWNLYLSLPQVGQFLILLLRGTWQNTVVVPNTHRDCCVIVHCFIDLSESQLMLRRERKDSVQKCGVFPRTIINSNIPKKWKVTFEYQIDFTRHSNFYNLHTFYAPTCIGLCQVIPIDILMLSHSQSLFCLFFSM